MAFNLSSLLSTGFQVGGQFLAGQSERSAANYRAKVARNNAIIAREAAGQAIERGRIEEQAIRTQGEQTLGSVRASAAARGVQVDTGSNLVSQTDVATLTELDALTARINARREAINFERQAVSFDTERQLEKQGKRNASLSSFLSIGGTVASKWHDIFPKDTP